MTYYQTDICAQQTQESPDWNYNLSSIVTPMLQLKC